MMKKLKICSIAILLVLLVGCAILLLSCDAQTPTDPCAAGHTEVVDAGVAATCTSKGLSEGKHCSVCNKVLVAQTVTEKAAHTPDEWVVTLAASCTGKGSQYRKCTVCSNIIETQILEPLAHQYGEPTVTKPATCTAKGEQSATCTVCEDVKTEKIDALSHEPGEWITGRAATCTEKGTQTRTCKRCSSPMEARETEKLGHDYGDWVTKTPATCTTLGEKTRSCARTDCGDVDSEPIAYAAHTGGTPDVKVPATCEKEGVQHIVCTVCENVEIEILPPTDHQFNDWAEDIPATCSATGKRTRTCKNCPKKESEIIPLADHNYTDWILDVAASCAAPGSRHRDCTACLVTVEIESLAQLEHNYSEWTQTTAPTCSTLGTRERTCPNCETTQKESIPTLPHTEGSWVIVLEATETSNGTQTKECTVCHNVIAMQSIPATGVVLPVLYRVDGSTVTITGYKLSNKTQLVIPATIAGLPVTKIASGAFLGATQFESITLPASLTNIEENAFDHCSAVTVSNGLTYLDGWLLRVDASVTSLTLPASIKRVASNAMKDCRGISAVSASANFRVSNGCLIENATGTVVATTPTATIPTDSTVTAIGAYAFAGRNSARNLAIPSNIQSIGEGAFYGWYSLNTLTVPSSVHSVGEDAFGACHTLVRVLNQSGLILPLPTNVGLEVKTSNSFSNTLSTNDIITYKVGSTTYLLGYTGSSASLSLSGVNAVYAYALAGNKTVRSLSIPSTLTNIGVNAFANCEIETLTAPYAAAIHVNIQTVKTLTVTGSGKYILSNFLNGGSSLETVVLPSDFPRVMAFEGCVNIKSLTAPAEAMTKASGLIYTKLETLNINGGEVIANQAFHTHPNLKSVTIAASVTTIKGQAFHASTLETVTFQSGSKLKEIQGNAFCSTPLRSINLPTRLETIGSQCFMNCKELVSCTLPSTVTTINEEAFHGCSALQEITIPASVEFMGSRTATNGVRGMFANCTSLKKVTFAANSKLKILPTYAFYGCTSLTSITIPKNVISIGFSAFEASGVTSVAFENTSGWKVYALTSFSNQVAKYEFKNLGTGTAITVTNTGNNATEFKTTYAKYFWKRG